MLNTLKQENGFSLIEMMIAIAIMGILAAVALTLYLNYTDKAYLNGCYQEAKDYSSAVFYATTSPDNHPIPQPNSKVCVSISDASEWDYITPLEITAVVKNNDATILCDFSNGMKCDVVE